MIAILDYGAGNLRSVETGFARAGVCAAVTSDPDTVLQANGVVLPGVGAFTDAMRALENSGLIPAIRTYAASGRPFLGICLGMQALFAESEEGAGVKGLGLIPGTVRRLPDCGLKIPHMGWNSLKATKASPLLTELPDEPYAYFVHSYACHAAEEADVLTVTEYGVPFHSAVQRGNILGVQFHPEKSGAAGRIMLKNFLHMAGEVTGDVR